MTPRTTVVFLLATILGVAVGVWLGIVISDAILS